MWIFFGSRWRRRIVGYAHLLLAVGSPKYCLSEFLCKVRVMHECGQRPRNAVRRKIL